MAISDTQKTDYLWKKLGYGVAKTDLSTAKQAFEESISSPLLLRGDNIWQQSGQVPSTMPSTTSGVVTLYKDGTGGWSSTVKCTEDLTSGDNRTWKTNLTDWISPEFGASYQVQVYIANDTQTSPQTAGTKIFAAGSGNNDEWFFDYQSGVLHFIGTNIPTAIAAGITGKSIFISGARYSGIKGLSQSVSTSATIGNISVSENTISSTDTNQNIVLDPNGTGNIVVVGNLLATDFYGNLHFTGTNTELIFIDNGIGNSNTNLTFDKTSNTLGVGSSSGTISVGGASITANTTSGTAGLFNLLISNVNIGLSSNVTLGSTSGNVTARGNLIANNIATSGNVSANVVAVGSISGNRANVTVTTDTEIDSFLVSNYRSAKYIVSANDGTGYQALEALVIHDGSDSYITVYGAISSTDADIVTLSSNIVSGNVKVYATRETAITTTVNYLGTYVKD